MVLIVMIGNGSSMEIQHIGSTNLIIMHTQTKHVLKDLLDVVHNTKNLINMSKFVHTIIFILNFIP